MPRYDLHAHSTASDGLLSPAALVAHAIEQEVDVLALTDHDDTAGLAEAAAAAEGTKLELVPGIELSVTWGPHTLHIVGLRIDPRNAALEAGLTEVRQGRDARAHKIADSLAAAGIGGAYEGARKYVTSERLISRTHFARFLVEKGHAKDPRGVFKRFLVRGKPGYAAHAWPALAQAVGWIHGAGGQAVLAHPARYTMSPTAMRRLLGEFRDLGGDGIEVFSGSHTRADAEAFATQARLFGLLASSGSDYHGPAEGMFDVGALPDLPSTLTPVWSKW